MSLRQTRQLASRWMEVREQLDIDDVPERSLALTARGELRPLLRVCACCPSCGRFIGSWPEGGHVVPPGLWEGLWTCKCGWAPVLDANSHMSMTGELPG